MTAPTQKTHYDTPQKSRVQGEHEYMLAKGIPHDPRDVFGHFSVKERAGYNMIQPCASSRTHHNSGFETRGRKYKMTSEQVQEADHRLEDDDLDLEAKALPWEGLAAEVEAKVTGQTIRKTINVVLGYGKRLVCMKGHKSGHAKIEWNGPHL